MAKNKQNFDLQNLHELNAPIKIGHWCFADFSDSRIGLFPFI